MRNAHCVAIDAGDPVVRPQSEFKVSTPIDKPPSAPLSAPPNVIEQAKMEGNARHYVTHTHTHIRHFGHLNGLSVSLFSFHFQHGKLKSSTKHYR